MGGTYLESSWDSVRSRLHLGPFTGDLLEFRYRSPSLSSLPARSDLVAQQVFTMEPDQYQRLTERTEASPVPIVQRLFTREAARVIHAQLGIAGETGELTEAIKRWLIYGQELDIGNIKEELGDLLWYVALLCNVLEISLSDVMEANIRKLKERYPQRYTDELALEENRDRGQEQEALEAKGKETDPLPPPTTLFGSYVPFGVAHSVASMILGRDQERAYQVLKDNRVEFLGLGSDGEE